MKTINVISFRRLVRDASSFDEAIEDLLDAGTKTKARAIMLARKHDPTAYNEWVSAKHGRTVKRRSGGGYLQHFKIIGA